MTKIEWTEQTWNPIVGCSLESPGCAHCYAMKMAARIERMNPGLAHYQGLTRKVKGEDVWTGKLALAPEHILLEPLRRKKPTKWFVNSMSDPFHEDVPDEWIDIVMVVMRDTPHHTYQMLTKRSARMRDYFARLPQRERDMACHSGLDFLDLPLPNVWLGVSAEDQWRADVRIPDLLSTPAAVRFVSAEPLLGPIVLEPWLSPPAFCQLCDDGEGYGSRCSRGDIPRDEQCPSLDWVIVGGESGPDARPMHPDWARAIRDQCQAADVPFFFKQWGAWEYARGVNMDAAELVDARRERILSYSGGVTSGLMSYSRDAVVMRRVGKATAGRLLDGRTWDEMPVKASVHRQAETENA